MRNAVAAVKHAKPVKLAEQNPELTGLRVLVLGLGKSGVAAAKFALSKGASVVAADQRSESELAPQAVEIRARGGVVHAGGHPAELALAADLVVVSPGVPLTTPVLREAADAGLPVWSEVELAFRFCQGRVVGVTGSNGKSTTTAMIGSILKTAGTPGGVGGNLGTPFTELLAEDGPKAVHAVELSSFQLEAIHAFHAAVGVVVNLSPDHLDRYPSVAAYTAAKARLLQTQRPGEAAVLNADDPASRVFESAVRGRLFRFSTQTEVEQGAFVRNGTLVIRTEDGENKILPVDELPVPGDHNVQNAAAAALSCSLAGCAPSAIAGGLRAYKALPHRLEFVASFDGVSFYNDSKATNLDATVRAIQAFPPGTVHLILGGRDKGAEWSSLAALAEERIARVLLVGEAAATIRGALEGVVLVEDCGTVRTAVRVGFEGAVPDDVVLLAPGCASFDQYRNFEARGEDFKQAVHGLFPEGEHRA